MSDVLNWHGWSDLTVLVFGGALIGCVAFVIRYHLLSGGAWSRTSEGRWMVWGRIIIAATCVLILANRVFGDWPGRRPITFVVGLIFAAQCYWPILLVDRAHRGDGHHRQHEGAHRK